MNWIRRCTVNCSSASSAQGVDLWLNELISVNSSYTYLSFDGDEEFTVRQLFACNNNCDDKKGLNEGSAIDRREGSFSGVQQRTWSFLLLRGWIITRWYSRLLACRHGSSSSSCVLSFSERVNEWRRLQIDIIKTARWGWIDGRMVVKRVPDMLRLNEIRNGLLKCTK